LEIGNHYLDGKGWLNCGQIAFEWLKSEGVDVERFKKRQAGIDAGNIRKRLKRGAGGEITVPCPDTNKSVQDKLKQKVLSGDINVGELIVPRKVINIKFILLSFTGEMEQFA
jgi:hypothetical protein